MKKRPKLHELLMLFLLAGIQCCSGINPATAPAPLAEIPAAMRFPEEVKVEFESLAAVDKSLTAKSIASAKTLSLSDSTSFLVSVGISRAKSTEDFLDLVLEPLHAIGEIPVKTPVKHFVSPPVLVHGIIAYGATAAVSFKLDFSDFNGNGCSGTTCPVDCSNPLAGCSAGQCPDRVDPKFLRPVCFRIWADTDQGPQRVVSGYFDKIPSENKDAAGNVNLINRGAGKIRGIPAEQAVFGLFAYGNPDFPLTFDLYQRFEFTYDHSQENSFKLTDFRFKSLDQAVYFSLDAPPLNFWTHNILHFLISQRGPESESVKTVSQSFEMIQSDGIHQSSLRDSIDMRWREDADFISSSYYLEDHLADFGPGPASKDLPYRNFRGSCSKISTGQILAVVEPNGVQGETTLPIGPADFASAISPCRSGLAIDYADTPEYFDYPSGIDLTQYPNTSVLPLLPDFSTLSNDPFPIDFLSDEELTTPENIFVDFPETPTF